MTHSTPPATFTLYWVSQLRTYIMQSAPKEAQFLPHHTPSPPHTQLASQITEGIKRCPMPEGSTCIPPNPSQNNSYLSSDLSLTLCPQKTLRFPQIQLWPPLHSPSPSCLYCPCPQRNLLSQSVCLSVCLSSLHTHIRRWGPVSHFYAICSKFSCFGYVLFDVQLLSEIHCINHILISKTRLKKKQEVHQP